VKRRRLFLVVSAGIFVALATKRAVLNLSDPISRSDPSTFRLSLTMDIIGLCLTLILVSVLAFADAPSTGRLRRLHQDNPDLPACTVRWSRALAGDLVKAHVISEEKVRRLLALTVTLTGGHDGIIFWAGFFRPRLLAEIPWCSIEAINSLESQSDIRGLQIALRRGIAPIRVPSLLSKTSDPELIRQLREQLYAAENQVSS